MKFFMCPSGVTLLGSSHHVSRSLSGHWFLSNTGVRTLSLACHEAPSPSWPSSALCWPHDRQSMNKPLAFPKTTLRLRTGNHFAEALIWTTNVLKTGMWTKVSWISEWPPGMCSAMVHTYSCPMIPGSNWDTSLWKTTLRRKRIYIIKSLS
jgi:hypothetical protein